MGSPILFSPIKGGEVTGTFQSPQYTNRGTRETEGRKTIVITLNKVCKGRLRGRLRKELPSLGLSLFSRLVGRLRRPLKFLCEEAEQLLYMANYNSLKSKYF